MLCYINEKVSAYDSSKKKISDQSKTWTISIKCRTCKKPLNTCEKVLVYDSGKKEIAYIFYRFSENKRVMLFMSIFCLFYWQKYNGFLPDP